MMINALDSLATVSLVQIRFEDISLSRFVTEHLFSEISLSKLITFHEKWCQSVNLTITFTSIVTVCTSSQSKCDMGLCVYSSYWCNGYRHCPDGSDEKPGCIKG